MSAQLDILIRGNLSRHINPIQRRRHHCFINWAVWTIITVEVGNGSGEGIQVLQQFPNPNRAVHVDILVLEGWIRLEAQKLFNI